MPSRYGSCRWWRQRRASRERDPVEVVPPTPGDEKKPAEKQRVNKPRPSNVLKPNWKPSSSHRIFIPANICTQFLLQSLCVRACDKFMWQVTAKHACTLCRRFGKKWHGTWLYGVHRTCAETAAVSCATSHASAESTPLRWIFKKKRYQKLVTHVESHANAVSLLENGE